MKLLELDFEGRQKYMDGLEKECKGLRKQATQLAWSMRGGATITDVLNMSKEMRELITELSNENLETTQKSKLPYF